MKYAIIITAIIAVLFVTVPTAYGFYQSIHDVANKLQLISKHGQV